ncbi:peptidase inhibitor 15-like [Scleropages formosus]|uniref:Peptidase inhibitor 15-like n=1 Tax=Scleropages formosus TaxID=113540 RepID=A0A0N8K2E1_SCLFO|nr:peptidase inhibitor 15-like [Scleropages formosus]
MKDLWFSLELLLVVSAACALAGDGAGASPSPRDTNLSGAASTSGFHTNSTDGAKARRRRYISQNDMIAILDYHNKVRGKVFPPASNMEYMLWDDSLANSAEAWAATCLWDHGPQYLLRFLGQNLSVRTGRYRSILQLVKPWYDEVKDYVFPYPRDCNPRCPLKCYGPMCTHYTQVCFSTRALAELDEVLTQSVVYAFIDYVLFINNAVHYCSREDVGSVLMTRVHVLSRGNWIGEAPYKVGVPCSACPPSYGGSCSNNMCFPAVNSNYLHWFK